MPRESTTTYGGGSSTGVQPHRSMVSVSPASDFTSGGVGGGGIFSGSGVSSGGSVASGPLMSSRQGTTVIEIWLAEPYQIFIFGHPSGDRCQPAKNIIHLCAGNHSLFMRRRQPDSIDVQQMKAHEREERIRRETERARLLRERSEKAAALKLNAALESRCAELESALRSAAVAAGSLSPTSPVEPLLSSRRSSSRRKGMFKTGESGEEEGSAVAVENEDDVADGENLEEDVELRRRIGVQFSSREPQECPSIPSGYSRLQHQPRSITRRGGEGKKVKGGLVESPSIAVGSVEIASHQGTHTGIYEGFILVQSTAESAPPTRSEPAIPHTQTWSPYYALSPGKQISSISHCGKETESG
ncbi:unnamed protein product [Rodentolepis nana]|uniref:Uncharacterized protein n=1 Tax=Rodentolepis nana TaxID=102285 RepID=A0A3P7V6D3_RODNA|nr:unnamed protein product [Rodentolepis nana]